MKNLQVTPKQLEILNLLYRYRFLNRYHIQKFLNHKDPKRINTWLKDLYQQKIIGRHYSRKIGENTKPAIYYLSTKSKHILLSNANKLNIHNTNLNRVYREHTRSKKFVERSIFIADFYFYLHDSLETTQKLSFYTKTDLESFNYLPKPLPEAYIAIIDTNVTKRYFLEIFDEESPRFVARNRIARYCDYYLMNLWQKSSEHPFPSVLLVFADNKLQEYMMTFIPRYLDEETTDDIAFYLATKEKIEQTKLSASVWDIPVDI